MGTIALVLVVIILLVYLIHDKFNPDLSGWWIVSDAFKEQAGLKQMILYIGDDYDCFIVIDPIGGGGVSEHNSIKFHAISREIEFDTAPGSMPKRMKITVDVKKGYMRLYDGDTSYAELYRDSQMSDKVIIEED